MPSRTLNWVESWRRDNGIETLFEDFDGYLEQQDYLAMGGQIIDASIVPVRGRGSG